MRRLTLVTLTVAALIATYGLSPLVAWIALAGSAALVLTRRMRRGETVRADR